MELSIYLIEKNLPIIDAMKKLDETGAKVLFLHESGKLLASLSDGDIRRWILANGQLTEVVSKAANYHPIYVYINNLNNYTSIMKRNNIEVLPVLDENDIIVSVKEIHNRSKKNKTKLDIPVIMMAGGKGTRLYPFTKILPKALVPVNDTPISELIINRFFEYGCNEFHLILNHKKNMIKAYFNDLDKEYSIKYHDEEYPLGTGGGLSLLRNFITGTFILTNCDTIIEEDFSKIYEQHKKNNNIITMICSLKDFTLPYGVVDLGNEGEILQIKEKPRLSFFTNTGCYIVDSCVLDMIEDGENVGFPNVVERCREKGWKIGVYPISERSWLDMGQLDELKRMELLLNEGNT